MHEAAEQAARKIRAGLDRAQVFGNPPDVTIYRRLAKEFHPDRNKEPDAARIFAAANDIWEGKRNPFDTGARFTVLKTDGTQIILRPLAHESIPSGLRFTGKRFVGYEIKQACADQAQAVYGALKAALNGAPQSYFSFGTKAIREQCLTGPDGFLPRVEDYFAAQGGALFVRLAKEPSYVPLNLVLARAGGKLEPEHVAWILSGLYNAACYMQHTGVVHLGLTLESLYVEPATHRTALLGGWEHAVKEGAKPVLVPGWIAEALPRRYRGAKRAELGMTLEIIRALGRTLLGDPNGTQMIRDKANPISRFLLGRADGSAIDQYRDWRSATAAHFGGHRFFPMEEALVANPSIIYEEKSHG